MHPSISRSLSLAVVAVSLAACGLSTELTTDETTEVAAAVPVSTVDTPAADSGSPSTADGEASPAATDHGIRIEGQELVRELDGHVSVLATLPDEGESVFRAAAVRPGDHAQLTVLTLTSAEGMYDLRWLDVEGTSATELRALPAHLQPLPDHAAAEDVPPAPVWAPDGSAFAFLEWNARGDVQLRTIGWADGPGTGDTATDNAAFGLDLPAGVTIASWSAAGGSTSILRIVSVDGAEWDLTLERQGDGAFGIGADALQPAG